MVSDVTQVHNAATSCRFCPVSLFLLSQNLLHPVHTASSAGTVVCPIGWGHCRFALGDVNVPFLPNSVIVSAANIMRSVNIQSMHTDGTEYKDMTGYRKLPVSHLHTPDNLGK